MTDDNEFDDGTDEDSSWNGKTWLKSSFGFLKTSAKKLINRDKEIEW